MSDLPETDAHARNKRLQSKAQRILQAGQELTYNTMINEFDGWLEQVPAASGDPTLHQLAVFAVLQRNKLRADRQKIWEDKYGAALDANIAQIRASEAPGKGKGVAPGESSGDNPDSRAASASGSRPRSSASRRRRGSAHRGGVAHGMLSDTIAYPDDGASMASLLMDIRERQTLHTLMSGVDAGLVPLGFVAQVFEKANHDDGQGGTAYSFADLLIRADTLAPGAVVADHANKAVFERE
ncbi:hypothetical protein CYLTODRAFT_458704 [Cylindrobasidium torrendii FP15055 ss-10]|uniref:Uncharacterized protein n=1 Tax=Cylindrobasidium torrendii FP15055 ss-10 TaxID=1314674 RepID=A0A0D7AWL8_9AGAR|nr:hypothetical protein CYLTODRAFT_458704 [Cylindrobasidium torrendii FP15055 ss-10]